MLYPLFFLFSHSVAQLAPKYEELGQAFAKVSGVTIAKIDGEPCLVSRVVCCLLTTFLWSGTANDVDSHAEIKGFPTLLFYKSNDKKNPSTCVFCLCVCAYRIFDSSLQWRARSGGLDCVHQAAHHHQVEQAG
jgi:hypothetical protein